jgi:hypothetical protein
MTEPTAQEIFILGVTREGQTFRPSDWAERLAGVMSPFRPGGAHNRHHPASYSSWCVPTTLNGTKCVVVHLDLRQAEPMAFDFVMNFARDNELQTVEGCLLPTPGVAPSSPVATDALQSPSQSRFDAPLGLQMQA